MQKEANLKSCTNMELTETVTANNLPDSFDAFFEHKHMDNTLKVSFKEIEPGKTEFTYEGEYVKVRGLMPKLMMILFPSMFKEPAQKWYTNFKAFVEKQN